MYGPEDLGRRAVDWLYGRIPARLRIIEARLDQQDPEHAPHQLADPAQVLDHERGPIGLEDWPSVFVLPQELTATQLVDVHQNGGEEYLNTYRVQVLAWVRADSYESTSRLRLRYALAIREALLERKSLKLGAGLTAGDPHHDLTVDPSSIRESYSPLIDDEGRTIAGVTVTVSITARELLEPPPALGVVEDTAVDVHPAFT
jgi:hypothetical protein